jgi:threonine aldolase
MDFRSDNTHGASPEIAAALTTANTGTETSYGDDTASKALVARFADLFEHEVAVFPVVTGTAANALALSVTTPPFGAVYCHAEAHIMVDECGAPEFYAGGAKLVPLDGADGKIAADDLAAALAADGTGNVHQVQPATLSLTQLTECGTAYRVDEIAALAGVARGHGLRVHMDGARFANALVGLGCTPAEMTWRAGVDILSFGATKNGAWAAEAVVVFAPELAAEMAFRRKRAGHLLSKMRFVAAQLEAYLTDELWLRNAAHANAMAGRLAQGLGAVPGAGLAHPVDGNQLFVRLPAATIEALSADGFMFHRWPETVANATVVRLVTAFDTSEADIAAFVDAAARHGEAAA